MLTSILRQALVVLGYPRLDRQFVGRYPVGAVKLRIPHATACQVFYPCNAIGHDSGHRRRHGRRKGTEPKRRTTDQEKNKESASYFRSRSVRGLIEYVGTGDGLLQFLCETPHPCHVDAEPLSVRKDGTTRENHIIDDDSSHHGPHPFPLVLFSHGLGGNMELYTLLCSHMASLGYCVVALEHEDGSAAFAETSTGTFLPYLRPNDEPYSRNKVLKFRTPMLEQRVQEIHAVWEYLVTIKGTKKDATSTVLLTTEKGPVEVDGSTNDNDDVWLGRLMESVDPSQVHLVGHSFGGATQIIVAQEWNKVADKVRPFLDNTVVMPTSLTVLDPWAFSLSDEVLDRGMPRRRSPTNPQQPQQHHDDQPPFPILSVISEGWTTNVETAQIVQFLQHCYGDKDNDNDGGNGSGSGHNAVFSYYAKNSVHQSFSDSEAWFPTWIATRLYNRGRHERRHETIRAVIDAWRLHCCTESATSTEGGGGCGNGGEGEHVAATTTLRRFPFLPQRTDAVPIKEEDEATMAVSRSLSS